MNWSDGMVGVPGGTSDLVPGVVVVDPAEDDSLGLFGSLASDAAPLGIDGPTTLEESCPEARAEAIVAPRARRAPDKPSSRGRRAHR